MTESANSSASPAAVSPTFERGPDYQAVFSNQTRMRVGYGEITITFGHLDELPGEGVVVEDKVSVVLTPHHAKIIAKALKGVVKEYERHYGKIALDVPPPMSAETLMNVLAASTKEDD